MDTRAYYNEIDPFAAEWLRNLIKEGLIPDGKVDTRSITEVDARDLAGFTQCHFFAGIGGWSYALRLASWPDDRPVWTGSCPCQPFSVAGKGRGTADERHLWPEFHRLIRECRPAIVFGEQVASRAGREWFAGVRADLEGVGYGAAAADLCAAGVGAPHIRQRLYWVAQDVDNAAGARRRDFGCTPLGSPRNETRRAGFERRSGDGVGVADANSELRDGRGDIWPRGWDEHSDGSCSGDMADADSQSIRGRVPSEIAGAPRGYESQVQQRKWVWPDVEPDSSNHWADAEWRTGADGKERRVKSGVRLLVDGVANRVGRLRGYGNAIVPQVAAEVIKAFMDA